jgi:prephenate dehydrogenase
MKVRVLTIVGVGLIGGSIGLAAKGRGLADCVRGLGRRPESLAEAKSRGAIDEIHLDPAIALADSDLVVLCTPVDQIADQAIRFAALCRPGAILIDAGSTKGRILEQIDGRLPPGVAFVGSHPLAGSEKKGVAHADAELFAGRWTVVTPTPQTDVAALEKVMAFWTALGSRVRRMSPAEHDEALAVTSHVPHLVASALAGILPESLAPLTATGFRDTTRIAAGDPELWTAIFTHNASAVLSALTTFQSRLEAFRRGLEQRDAAALDRLLAEGKAVRDALGNGIPHAAG